MNMKEFKPQEKTVVAIGQPADWRDPATVVIGMSDVAFAAMADGRTHTVDLTSQGISVQIVIFREPRSEERRVGKGWVRSVRSRWSPVHSKKNKMSEHT